MKKGFLPLGFLTLLISGVAALFFISASSDDATIKNSNDQSIVKAKEWLVTVRNNQNTGLLDPRDVLNARKQANEASYKSADGGDLNWVEMGPSNMGGRTRALIVDNRDESAKTLYAAGVNGGIFKTTNLGAIWTKVNTSNGTANLNVSCMIQTSDGTIYVGTGEAFNNQDYSGLGEMGFVSGFVGQGIFKSDGNDNFTLVEGTEPTANNETVEWAFVNEIAMASNGYLWAATNTGLKVKTSSGWMYAQFTDTLGVALDLTGIARDVEVHSNGLVVAAVDGLGYASSDGSPSGFVTFSLGEEDNLPAEGIGRLQLAIAPSDENIVYAMAAKSSNNALENVYLSEDKGRTWRIIGPGGSESLNILGTEDYYQGDYNNVLEVFPNDPYHILAGGVNVWEGFKVDETGFYSWGERSISNVLNSGGILSPVFVHADHHVYAFRPGTNEFFLGTDGGVYKGSIGSSFFTFQVLNKNYNVTQFYTVDVSNKLDEAFGGSQDNGTIFIGGSNELPMPGADLWNYGNELFPEGSDGGYCAISTIRKYETIGGVTPPPIFYSKSPLPNEEALTDRMRRSQSMAFDYSSTFLKSGMSNSNFLTPMALWENFTNENSRDSVDFVAHEAYQAGDEVVIRSVNYNHPFKYTLPNALNNGDTIRVQDIISTRLFIATKEKIWMTKEALNFGKEPEWFLISDKNNSGLLGNPQCIAYSADANYLYVGTQEGNLYRISNLALAYDFERADVTSPNCIVATDVIELMEGGNTQVVTSISVDPLDADKVLVTLGNYGNTDYVFYSSNATSDTPGFTSVQGNLPAMPVYASVLEMGADDKAVIGTDDGIWTSDNVSNGQWVQQKTGMGNVPVMALKQQQVYKGPFTITTYDPATNQPFYEIFQGIDNYGVIYAATYGRGIFRAGDVIIGTDENEVVIGTPVSSVSVYPNPVVDLANLKVYLSESSDVQIQVFDMSGRLVQSVARNDLQKGDNTVRLDVSDLNKGTYIVKMVAGNIVGTSKFVIVK